MVISVPGQLGVAKKCPKRLAGPSHKFCKLVRKSLGATPCAIPHRFLEDCKESIEVIQQKLVR